MTLSSLGRRSLLSPSYLEIHRFFTKVGLRDQSIATRHARSLQTLLTNRRNAKDNFAIVKRQSICAQRRNHNSCPTPNCPNNDRTTSKSDSSLALDDQPVPSSSSSNGEAGSSSSSTSTSTALSNPSTTSRALSKTSPSYLSSLPASIRRLAVNLPSYAPGRPPSRDQLLEVTTSFFERLRIRFKWATIRSYRRFRADDYSAFFSFGILGTLGWFLLSTTSFLAFCFLVVNSLSSQNWLATKLGNYLTKSTGVRVVFESAIVPKWGVIGGSSKIVFKNVFVSRGTTTDQNLIEGQENDPEETVEDREERERMSKWTHFHLSIDTIEVTLSLRRWLDGKGLVKDASVKGVRGVVDRSHIVYDPTAPRDRFAYRHVAHPGDFWLESLQIEDFLVTIYQPDQFRPYTFSIFNADIRRLRKQWLFYDLMSAESVVGQVDNCLFSLHKPQSIGRTSEEDLKDARWARMSRFRIDAVPIDHMQSAKDTGVLSWITSGRCDLVADIRFPRDGSEIDLSTIVSGLVDEIGERLQITTLSAPYMPSSNTMDAKGDRIPGRGNLTREALTAPEEWQVERRKEAERRKEVRRALRSAQAAKMSSDDDQDDDEDDALAEDEKKKKELWLANNHSVSIDLDIRFKDLKASVPYFTSDLSYVNNALIRPIVAFINSHHTLVPIRCHLDLDLDEFDGSWTTYDVGLLDRLSEETYAALAHHVQNANQQRLQAVSLWTLQMTAQGVLAAFRNNFATSG